MNKRINIDFSSSVNEIVKYNRHFDKGILRIAYHGRNRNGSDISKNSFERAIIKSLFYTPVVTHLLDNGELGGHDSEITMTNDGEFTERYLTTPVGLVPHNANYWWELVQEDNGDLHEYLCTEILLWKRQDAYNKIKQDGKVKHSMEIEVESYEINNDVFVINDFTFTAFCLIGVEPCFEGSNLTLFSLDKDKFRQEFSDMIKDLKEDNEVIKGMEDNKVIQPEVTEPVVEPVVEHTIEPTIEPTQEPEVVIENTQVVEEPTVEDGEVEPVTEPEITEEPVVENEPEISIEEKYATLEKEFAELKLEYAEVKKECERLSQFEKDLLDIKKKDVFTKYSNVLTEDDMRDVIDNSEKYSLEEIENNLNKIIAEKTLTSKNKFSKTNEGLFVADVKKDKMKNRYAI